LKSYAIGHLRNVAMGPSIVTYLERIDATLAPHGGKFIVHGGAQDLLEGTFACDVIIIEFPDIDMARAWYRSGAYQAILPLRTKHSDSTVFLVRGVDADHKATDILG